MTRRLAARLLVVGSVAALGVVGAAAPARADAPTGDWTAPTPDDGSVTTTAPTITGTASHEDVAGVGVDHVDVRLTPSGGQGGDPLTFTRSGGGQPSVSFTWDPPLACNGRSTLTGTMTTGSGPLHPSQTGSLPTRTFQVVVPPKVPAGIKIGVDPKKRVVYLSWDHNPERDVTGYQVERRLGSGSYQVVASPAETVAPSCAGAPSSRSGQVLYGEVPPTGGEFSYRVTALRCDGTWDAGKCKGTVASGKSASASVSVPAPPPTTTAPSTTTTTAKGTGETSRSGIDLQSRYGDLRNQAQRRSTAPTEPDPGFSDKLPFVAGDRPAEPQAGETAIGGRQVGFESGGSDQRALLVPVAVALILLVIAMQLRWLMRVATPLEALPDDGAAPGPPVSGPPAPSAPPAGSLTEVPPTRLVEWVVPAAALRRLDAWRATRRARAADREDAGPEQGA